MLSLKFCTLSHHKTYKYNKYSTNKLICKIFSFLLSYSFRRDGSNFIAGQYLISVTSGVPLPGL